MLPKSDFIQTCQGYAISLFCSIVAWTEANAPAARTMGQDVVLACAVGIGLTQFYIQIQRIKFKKWEGPE